MHERRFNREIERLRDPDRIARLEVEQVVNLALESLGGVPTRKCCRLPSSTCRQGYFEKG
jgi:hypothetical protein